tara:strand:- start:18006 stop:19157 length:1152 start_codon:yes stop_codon:yes gene_type:complete
MFLSDRLKITTEREYTDEGFLRVPARISRIGIQEYLAVEMGLTDRDPNDIIKIYRPEEEVFKDASLSSFANKPVTNNHPPELVNASNSREYSVGMSGPEITRDGMFVTSVLHVMDVNAIKNIESGKVELSNGYTADIDWTAGVTPDGENYDAVQRNIKGNHIAIVERGRAGASCKVADTLPTTGEKAIMAKITIDGVDFEVSDQAAQAVTKLQGRMNDAEKETEKKEKEVEDKDDEMEEEAKKSKKTEDALRAQLDDATSKIPSAETLDSLVKARTSLVDSVLKVAPSIKWEGKDEKTLKAEAVLLNCPNVQMDSVSEDYISARFDMLVDAKPENSQSTLDAAIISQVNNDNNTVVDTRTADVIAREKMMTDSQNAWKKAGVK